MFYIHLPSLAKYNSSSSRSLYHASCHFTHKNICVFILPNLFQQALRCVFHLEGLNIQPPTCLINNGVVCPGKQFTAFPTARVTTSTPRWQRSPRGGTECCRCEQTLCTPPSGMRIFCTAVCPIRVRSNTTAVSLSAREGVSC